MKQSHHKKELYDVEISPELVTEIAEKIMPEVTAWQNRPPEWEGLQPTPLLWLCRFSLTQNFTECPVSLLHHAVVSRRENFLIRVPF